MVQLAKEEGEEGVLEEQEEGEEEGGMEIMRMQRCQSNLRNCERFRILVLRK